MSRSSLLCGMLCVLAMLPCTKLHAADDPTHCMSPEYRQFDFWLGDWDAFDIGGTTQVARLHVDRLLDGCVIHERYEGADGHQGESFSIYDRTQKIWHQSWVTNRGELLTIEGAFKMAQ